ncbi:succinylglutamate desuccinylase/aspartoacylase domain-containing protein [Paenibacillus caui]|uniref:succinylglutamate desuccinylase/aspartoacylase domain-containing protein n=1 Tax=Paenibacillus caui TaxID=2873927 RepID=UPI001CA9690C|nr:succinylglutamate desuccinylase/aspartoacylase family protein [Paenibacillus caui]
MIKTEDYLKYATIEEAFACQPKKSIGMIRNEFEGNPAVFFLIKGYDDGPVVWIQAALHGDEYDGVIACAQLLSHLDVNRLKGSILVYPVANPAAFLAGSNGSPADHVNLNRIFAQEWKDSYSYHYGAWLLDRIIQYADFFIDLHGGGKYLDVCPFAMVPSSQEAVYKKTMAVVNNLNLTAVYECNSGQKGMFINEVAKNGIPAVLLESGGGLSWSNDGVKQHEQSIRSILITLSMLSEQPAPGECIKTTKSTYHITEIKELRFDTTGLQVHQKCAGDLVQFGDSIIEILTFPHYEDKKITCPIEKAIILSIHTASLVKPEDYAVMLGIIH